MEYRQEAPGEFEVIRAFLNTWSIPNDTRVPTDRLPAMLEDRALWEAGFPAYARGKDDTLDRLRALREDLRVALQPGGDRTERLNRWLAAAPARIGIETVGEDLTPYASANQESGFVGRIMAIVTDALIRQQWSRLKACEDCQWVFYDWTRNQSKKWCGMTKGSPEGRACGTIAKVRRFRARQNSDDSAF
ncbi:MAG: CGNR zinc finger domain-containing protein [Dongiaceae bacterium]